MNTLDISTKHTNDYLDASEFNEVVAKINELVAAVNDLSATATDISQGTVYGLMTSYEWDGQNPVVPSGYGLYVNGKYLTETVHYRTYLTGNDGIGTATMTFVGIGNYNGQLQKQFAVIAKQFTIKYNAMGHGSTPASVKGSSLPAVLPTLSVSDPRYTFAGWYYDETLTQQAVAGSSISADVTLYAKWVYTKISVTYIMNGHGTQISPVDDTIYLPNPLPSPTDAGGAIFAGWYTDGALTTQAVAGASITANTTLYAKWTFQVSYVINGHGSQPATVTVNKLPNPLPVLTDADIRWKFGGWYTDSGLSVAAVAGAVIDATTTLYAKWTKEAVTLTYNVGSHGEAIDTKTYDDQESLVLPSPLPTPTIISGDAHAFVNWYTDSVFSTLAVAGAALTQNSTTIYAKYSTVLTFDANGHGTAPTAKSTDSITAADLAKTMTATGYLFCGWYTTAACTTPATAGAITKDTTIYAKWIQTNVALTLDDSTGSNVLTMANAAGGDVYYSMNGGAETEYTDALTLSGTTTINTWVKSGNYKSADLDIQVTFDADEETIALASVGSKSLTYKIGSGASQSYTAGDVIAISAITDTMTISNGTDTATVTVQ